MQSLNPESYHSGATLFSGKAGEALFNSSFTLLDVAVDPENGSFRPFDDEGVVRPVQNREIVRNGTFIGPLYDLRTAHKFKTESTGNGHRGTQGPIMVAPNGIDLAAGTRTISEWLDHLGETVVILMAGGGDTTADGEFSTPAHVAFLVRDGVVVGRLPQITVRGNIRDYLGADFIGSSRDRIASGNSRALFTRLDTYLN
jgi:PmbA protein